MIPFQKCSSSYPESLWAGGGVNEVASPREGGGPSRHQKLSIKFEVDLFQTKNTLKRVSK